MISIAEEYLKNKLYYFTEIFRPPHELSPTQRNPANSSGNQITQASEWNWLACPDRGCLCQLRQAHAPTGSGMTNWNGAANVALMSTGR